MHDLAKMFLHCVNHWKLETPTVKKQHSQGEDLAVYKMNYTRSELSLLSNGLGKFTASTISSTSIQFC